MMAARPLVDERKRRRNLRCLLTCLEVKDLRVYGEKVCGLAFADSAPKDEIVGRIIANEARKGPGADRLSALVEQVSCARCESPETYFFDRPATSRAFLVRSIAPASPISQRLACYTEDHVSH